MKATDPSARFDPSDGWGEAALRSELARLLQCAPLAGSPKLGKLLCYLFEETLSGRGEGVSQYTIAFDCFGAGSVRGDSATALVRSHARRLRKLLDELAVPGSACRIAMRRKGYSLCLEVSEPGPAGVVALPDIAVGVMEFEVVPDDDELSALAVSLADHLSAELAAMDLVVSMGPIPRSLRGTRMAHPVEVARQLGLDYLVCGQVRRVEGGAVAGIRITESSSGLQIWTSEDAIGLCGKGRNSIRGLAGRMAARIAGDWGALPTHITRRVRSGPAISLFPFEAVMLARQYLTHFHFEHLGRCVQCLREAARSCEDAAVPATLAVLLNTVYSSEPRWDEPMNAREIHELAARASRLGPDDAWTRLALAVSAMLDGRRKELLEMAKRADREEDTPWMLVGALGALVSIQALDPDLGRRMIRRYCEDNPRYPRLVHLTLAFLAFAEGDLPLVREELARFGVPWGWASPLLSAACFAVEGNADAARSDWERVITAFPDLPQRWRETIGTQWHESHLRRIFAALESAGVRTGCL